MNKLLIIILLLLFFQFTKSQNYVDEKGLKQGLFIVTKNKVSIHQNYKNDTLNGFYYKKNDTTFVEKGFYKNGQKDSIWLEFYDNGNFKSKTLYEKGLKQDVSFIFRGNSQLFRETYYKNDTIVKELEYYPNYNLMTYFSNQTKFTYFENGNLKLKSTLVNDYKIDTAYNEEKELVFPYNSRPKLIESDTSIINNSKYKVSILYDYNGPIKNKYSQINYFYNLNYYQKDTVLNIVFEEDNDETPKIIQISPNNTLITNLTFSEFGEKLNTINYTTNWEIQSLNGEMYEMPSKRVRKANFKLDFGNLVIFRQPKGCDDTGRNPFEIKTKNGSIKFNNIDNLTIFETDLNKDNQKEIYIISYGICSSLIEIYKIEK